jgi:acetyl-CoA C-acetyltransferase
MMAKKYGFDRETLDRFALESHKRAAAATKSGAFKDEIVPLAVESGKRMTDEGVRYDASLESIPEHDLGRSPSTQRISRAC